MPSRLLALRGKECEGAGWTTKPVSCANKLDIPKSYIEVRGIAEGTYV